MMVVDNLVSGYGRIRVLEGFSVTVAPGECVGILGHNGMGKSTALKAIVGLLPTWSGGIRLGGTAIERAPAYRRARAGIGYVPQGRRIFANLSVRENLRFGAVAKGLDPVWGATEGAEFPELGRILDRPGGALSGGEQQLLALARALSGRPRILLLDEPTEGLAPSVVQGMVERLTDLRRRSGIAILLVEQNLDFIRALADRIVLIHRGRIVRELSREAAWGESLEESVMISDPRERRVDGSNSRCDLCAQE